MQKPQQKGKRSKEIQHIGNLFSQEVEVRLERIVYYTNEQIKELSKGYNMTQSVFINKMQLKSVRDEKNILQRILDF